MNPSSYPFHRFISLRPHLPSVLFLLASFLTGGTDAAAKVAGSKKDTPLWTTPAYALYRDRIEEGGETAFAEIRGKWLALRNARHELVRPFLRGEHASLTTPSSLFNVLYAIALNDLELNVIDGQYFRISPDFHYRMLFTRDVAYSSLLGANYGFAGVVKSHLRRVLAQRSELGFTTSRGQQIPIPAITTQEKVEDLNNNDFFEKYSTHPYARRTDDVCWVLGFWAALQVQSTAEELAWFLEEFDAMDRRFYAPFRDPVDQLYHGQASFIDIGGTGYPAGFTAQDSIMVKALSTNCLYAEAFRIMAEVARHLGRVDRAAELTRRSEEMRRAILREFRHPDGYYAYFKHRDGRLEPRREQLGSAFLVRFGILPPKNLKEATDGYPNNGYGSPLLHPFYPGNRVYHNLAMWPFANQFFAHAAWRVEPTDESWFRAYGALARHALQGNFNEVVDYATGGRAEKHARHYIWSAAAFLNLVHEMLFGLEVRDLRELRFQPHVPKGFGGETVLDGLIVQGTRCTIALNGEGRRPERVLLDGKPVQEPSIPLDGRPHRLDIKLSGSD